MCSFSFPVLFILVFFGSLGSEQTKIYRAKILVCYGAIRVDTKFEIRMSTFFFRGGGTGQIIPQNRAIGCDFRLAEIQSLHYRWDCCLR